MSSLTFIGTATTLLRLGAFTVLTDPNFLHRGQRAYLGKGLWSRRLTEPSMQPGDLPPLDAVVLSHLHGDHFDRVARRGLARAQPVLTTPAAARRLDRWGFDTAGLRTWEQVELTKAGETLTVQSLPAVHARGVMGALLPPVMGSLLEHRVGDGAPFRVYLSGDTLTGDHLSAIANRHAEPDVAVVHLGGTRVLLHTVTMDAEQGVDFLRRVRPPSSHPCPPRRLPGLQVATRCVPRLSCSRRSRHHGAHRRPRPDRPAVGRGVRLPAASVDPTGPTSKRLWALVDSVSSVPLASPAAAKPATARSFRFTEAQRWIVIDGYEAGATVAALAKQFDVKRQAISCCTTRALRSGSRGS